MRWIEIENCTEKTSNRRCFAAVSGLDNIFIPAFLVSTERDVYLAALKDEIRTFRTWRQLYVPVDWLATTFPHCAELCQQIEHKAFAYKEKTARQVVRQTLSEAFA